MWKRVVDLIWRLSTFAIKTALERDVPSHEFAPLPNKDKLSAAEALIALKVRCVTFAVRCLRV